MDRLEEIEARLEALPSEPEWKPEWDWRGYGEGVYDAWTQIRTFYQDNAHDHNEAFKIVADSAQADAAFIAAAPEDIRYLLSEVKRLRAELLFTTHYPSIEVDPSLPPNSLKIGDTLVTNIGLPDESEAQNDLPAVFQVAKKKYKRLVSPT